MNSKKIRAPINWSLLFFLLFLCFGNKTITGQPVLLSTSKYSLIYFIIAIFLIFIIHSPDNNTNASGNRCGSLETIENDTSDNEYDDWIGDSNNGTGNELIAPLRVFNRNTNSWSIYDYLHKYWSARQFNAFVVSQRCPRSNFIRSSECIKPALIIYWTMDHNSFDTMKLNVFGIVEKSNKQDYLKIDNITSLLSKSYRDQLLQNIFQEAFDIWSRVLEDKVRFQYIQAASTHKMYHDIIEISAGQIMHWNSHENRYESFSQKNTLAHANINFVHLNLEFNWNLTPHKLSNSYPILFETHTGEHVLLQISRKRLMERYNFRSDQALLETLRNQIMYRSDVAETTCLMCTTLHEIGHVLGLGHTWDKTSIMYRYILSNEVSISNEDGIIINNMYSNLKLEYYDMIRELEIV